MLNQVFKGSNREKIYLLGGPLEPGDARILDLVKVLDSLCAVDHDVRSVGLGAEAPDLPGLGDIELVLVGEVTATGLEVVPGVDITLVNVLGQTIGHGNGPHEKPKREDLTFSNSKTRAMTSGLLRELIIIIVHFKLFILYMNLCGVFIYLLCLLGDLDRHIWLDSSETVSL